MSTTPTSIIDILLYDQHRISNNNDVEYQFNRFNVHNLNNQSKSLENYKKTLSMSNEECTTNICNNHNFDKHTYRDQSNSFEKSTLITSMTLTNNQWMSNTYNYDDELHTYNTYNEFDQSQIEIYQPINSLCFSVIDSEFFDDKRYISLMNEINLGSKYDNELSEKIMKQKKRSTFGFSALQRRIEKVKHDLFNLTNKLSTNHSEENAYGPHCYYNLGIGDVIDDNEESFVNEFERKHEKDDTEKSWKCPSQCNSKNPFSELSESTQKILGRLHLKDNDVEEDQNDVIELNEDEIEMEEDELEFTFSNRQNNTVYKSTNKGKMLSIIEEQEEYDSSSDESENGNSTVIERCVVISDNSSTTQSVSMNLNDITDNDAYVTPMSSFRINEQRQDCSDDTEEYYSDFAKQSLSSFSSEESLRSQNIKIIDASCTETTLKGEPDHLEISENGSSLEDKLSSIKDEEDFGSEAEYDNSGWSTEDIPKSVEQSDSLYDKPYRPMLKSSLPDLLESSDSYDLDNLGGSLITRHYNKSTDLDEILNQVVPYHPSSDGRLSQSLCNLFTARSNKIIRPDDFFHERTSFDNLLETDLDSGYVSIYKPVKETEILSKVDFSCSIGTVNDIDESFNEMQAPLINKLREKAGSVSELRIADSLTKLNIPEWLNLRDEIECEKFYDIKSNLCSLPIIRSQTSLNRTVLSSQQKLKSLNREVSESSYVPVMFPKTNSSVVLPSQILRQSSQTKLTPIQFCQARKFLLPNKITVNEKM